MLLAAFAVHRNAQDMKGNLVVVHNMRLVQAQIRAVVQSEISLCSLV